ncbi:hypothetical protein Q3F60_12200, partial [Enterococcus faecium]|nr:hypothetical protein [Enterococcus faecium]
LRKLGKYMERKRRKEEKTSPILKLTIKIGLVFFWRKDYCPTLFFDWMYLSLLPKHVNACIYDK